MLKSDSFLATKRTSFGKFLNITPIFFKGYEDVNIDNSNNSNIDNLYDYTKFKQFCTICRAF